MTGEMFSQDPRRLKGISRTSKSGSFDDGKECGLSIEMDDRGRRLGRQSLTAPAVTPAAT